MQISVNELKKVIATGSLRVTEPIEEQEWSLPEEDQPLVRALTAEILEMPDRADRVEELRRKMADGKWNPTSAEIAEAMVRRAIADKVR